MAFSLTKVNCVHKAYFPVGANLGYAVKKYYYKFFPLGHIYLCRELADCRSVLDLGCGNGSPIGKCQLPPDCYTVGVDVFFPYLVESRRKGMHRSYILADMRQLELSSGCFDAVLLWDVLEHVNKVEGKNVLDKAEKWARRKVAIFTPNGFVEQRSYNHNSYQVHRSGWSVAELRALGYRGYGIDGLKVLWGKDNQLRWRPRKMWRFISNLSQKLCYFHPQWAYHLLAVKTIHPTSN